MLNSRFKGPDESPGFLLWQVSVQWRRQIEKALIDLGLTHPQFVLLAGVAWLTKNGERISQVDLAAHCKTDVTQTSQVLRNLEKKGWIKRALVKGDERAKSPQITKVGAKLLDSAVHLVESADAKFFNALDEKELNAFLDLAIKLRC